MYDPSDALTRARSRAYDALNRLAQDLGALGQTTTYGYDSNGNVTVGERSVEPPDRQHLRRAEPA